MSMKTVQEAQKGDRVWVKDADKLQASFIESVFINDCVTIKKLAGHGLYSRKLLDFGTTWGYLADNETVIGGQILRNPKADLWYVGVSSHWADSILENHKGFDDWCKTLDLSDADKAAIQEHVRRHSAPKKRTAADAKVGDEVWIFSQDEEKVHYGVIEAISLRLLLGIHISANGRGYNRAMEVFGTLWGFLEDRPQAQPAPEQPSPNFNNVKLLIKTKGAEWVKANAFDAWRAYVAAEMQEVRQEGDKLAKPGNLAGKTASPWG